MGPTWGLEAALGGAVAGGLLAVCIVITGWNLLKALWA